MRRPLLFAAGFFATASLHAGGAGTTGAPFLKVPMNARAVGMAGAFTAVEGDVTALEYNPAGLVNLRRTDIGLTYIDYLEDTSLQSFSLGLPVGPAPEAAPNGAFNTRKAVVGFQFRQFLASDDARNDVGVKTGTIDIRDQLFHAGAALAVTPMLSIGASLKYISEKLGDESIGTFAGDAGALWRGPQKIEIGASLLNAGPAKAFETTKDPLPTLLRLGAARPFGPALVAVDVSQGRDKVTRLAGGAEWGLGKYVKIRGGVFDQTSNLGFTAGLGVMVPGPMKSVPTAQRRGSVPPLTPRKEAANDLVFNEHHAADLLDRLNVLATDLIDRFHRAGLRPPDYPAAVLPASGAGDRMGAALADLVGQQLEQEFSVVDGPKVESEFKDFGAPANIDDDQAARLGDILKARAVVILQLTNSRDGYVLQARIVSVDTGNSVAAASTTLAADSFRGGRRETLASVPDSPADRVRGNNRVDWGLDYGFTSQDVLGVTHTITLRILY